MVTNILPTPQTNVSMESATGNATTSTIVVSIRKPEHDSTISAVMTEDSDGSETTRAVAPITTQSKQHNKWYRRQLRKCSNSRTMERLGILCCGLLIGYLISTNCIKNNSSNNNLDNQTINTTRNDELLSLSVSTSPSLSSSSSVILPPSIIAGITQNNAPIVIRWCTDIEQAIQHNQQQQQQSLVATSEAYSNNSNSNNQSNSIVQDNNEQQMHQNTDKSGTIKSDSWLDWVYNTANNALNQSMTSRLNSTTSNNNTINDPSSTDNTTDSYFNTNNTITNNNTDTHYNYTNTTTIGDDNNNYYDDDDIDTSSNNDATYNITMYHYSKQLRDYITSAYKQRLTCESSNKPITTICSKLLGIKSTFQPSEDYYNTSSSSSSTNTIFSNRNMNDTTMVYDGHCLPRYRLNPLGTGSMLFPYYASQLLSLRNENYTKVVIVQHGAERNADMTYCIVHHLLHSTNYANNPNTLIISPDFNYVTDYKYDDVHPNDALWNTTKPWGDWRVGAQSDPINQYLNKQQTISSFAIYDELLRIVTNRDLYPNINTITFAGHSAGGQMIQRYAMMSPLAASYDVLELNDYIRIQFIVANPSSYTYLDARRFPYSCGSCSCTDYGCKCSNSCTESNNDLLQVQVPSNSTVQSYSSNYIDQYNRRTKTRRQQRKWKRKNKNKNNNNNFTMDAMSYSDKASNTTSTVVEWPCSDVEYNNWPYGYTKLTDPSNSVPYILQAGTFRASKSYKQRNVIYLVGQNDTCNEMLPVCDSSCWRRSSCSSSNMDATCPAMLQGPNRKARAIQYIQYLQDYYGKPVHHLYVVPDAGHDAYTMFGSEIGQKVLFA